MSLRDKLRVLSQGAEAASSEELVADWTGAVASLFADIRDFLSEYQADNLLTLSEEQITLHEENLGDYAIARLNIRSGQSLVRLTPVGRLVAGALGRVDVANMNWPHYGYMLLRQGFGAGDWQIAHRKPNPLLATGGGSLDIGPIVFTEPLNKTSFELALDNLLG
jgi:hypothetical protein